MKLVIFILLSVLSLYSFSQKDTLFLFNDCYTIGEKKFNQKTDGLKEGNWIEYINKEKYIDMVMWTWSGFDSLGNDVHGSYSVYYMYAAICNYNANNSHITSNKSNTLSDTTIVLNYLSPEK